MSEPVDYKLGIEVVSPEPSGEAGAWTNDQYRRIADHLEALYSGCAPTIFRVFAAGDFYDVALSSTGENAWSGTLSYDIGYTVTITKAGGFWKLQVKDGNDVLCEWRVVDTYACPPTFTDGRLYGVAPWGEQSNGLSLQFDALRSQYTGATGPEGPQGNAGDTGPEGASGFSGYSGRSGFSGYSGPSGFSGYSGPSGFSGYSGQSGFSGYSGRSGFSGYSGASGRSGYSGFDACPSTYAFYHDIVGTYQVIRSGQSYLWTNGDGTYTYSLYYNVASSSWFFDITNDVNNISRFTSISNDKCPPPGSVLATTWNMSQDDAAVGEGGFSITNFYVGPTGPTGAPGADGVSGANGCAPQYSLYLTPGIAGALADLTIPDEPIISAIMDSPGHWTGYSFGIASEIYNDGTSWHLILSDGGDNTAEWYIDSLANPCPPVGSPGWLVSSVPTGDVLQLVTNSYTGTSGYSGFSGYSGPSGFSGYSGRSGFSGYSGPSGFSGYSGRSGFSGYSGSGSSGFSGYSGAGGSPGGANTQVQFNDSGSFGGDAGLTYNKTTDALTINGSLTVGGGQAITKILRATASLTFDHDIEGSGTRIIKTITVTGAAVGDDVALGIPNGATDDLFNAWVSASNTVSVMGFDYNFNASNISGTFGVTVFCR